MSNDTFPHRRKTGASIPGMLLAIPVLLLILLILAIGFYEARKAYWDYQVREMCAKDGGIKVYETVKLPPDKFNEWGQVNFWIPTKDSVKPTDDYYREWDIRYYRQGNPEFSRGHFRITRQKDEKLLGESVYYGRGGGDLPGPWHGSSFRCPADADISILKKYIFVLVEKEKDK